MEQSAHQCDTLELEVKIIYTLGNLDPLFKNNVHTLQILSRSSGYTQYGTSPMSKESILRKTKF